MGRILLLSFCSLLIISQASAAPISEKEQLDFRPVAAHVDRARRADGQRIARIYGGIANYQDQTSTWQKCDTTIEPEAVGEWTHTVYKAPYRARFRTDRPRYKFDANGGYVIWELEGYDQADSCQIIENRITWYLTDALDFQIICTPSRVKALLVLQNAAAPSAFAFAYQTSAQSISVNHGGRKAKKEIVFIQDGKVPFGVPKLHAYDSRETMRRVLPVTIALRLGHLEISADTEKAQYPVYVDPSIALDDPTEDGYLKCSGTVEQCQTDANLTRIDDTQMQFGGWWWDDVSYSIRAYAEWPIGALAGVTVTQVFYEYHGFGSSSTSGEINPLTEEQPSDGGCTDGDLWDYIASGTAYVDPFSVVIGTQQSIELGGSVVSDLQTAIDASQSWFAIGFHSPDDECPASGITRGQMYSEDFSSPNPPPTLTVHYSTGIQNRLMVCE